MSFSFLERGRRRKHGALTTTTTTTTSRKTVESSHRDDNDNHDYNHDNHRGSLFKYRHRSRLRNVLRGGMLLFLFYVLTFFVLGNVTVQDNNLAPLSNNYNNEKVTPGSVPGVLTTTSIKTSHDIVTLVHHNDMAVLIDYGLDSWGRFFLPTTSTNNDKNNVAVQQQQPRVFCICTPQALDRLKEEQAKRSQTSAVWNNLVLVDQSIFPFRLSDMGIYGHERDAWVYQQILKLYAHRVLGNPEIVAQHHDVLPRPLARFFLLIDSDTVAVRPFGFFVNSHNNLVPLQSSSLSDTEQYPRPILNFAADKTGAFPNDAAIARGMLAALWKLKQANMTLSMQERFHERRDWLKRALPERSDLKFTLVAHQMLFDGWIVNELLDWWQDIVDAPFHRPPFVSLSATQMMSEWELYGAYLMRYYRRRVVLQAIPYVNWGRCEDENLTWLREHTDIVYLTKHDNWSRGNICCVNTRIWFARNDTTATTKKTITYNQNQYRAANFECLGCPTDRIDHDLRLDCQALQVEGCRDDLERNLVFFDSVAS